MSFRFHVNDTIEVTIGVVRDDRASGTGWGRVVILSLQLGNCQ